MESPNNGIEDPSRGRKRSVYHLFWSILATGDSETVGENDFKLLIAQLAELIIMCTNANEYDAWYIRKSVKLAGHRVNKTSIRYSPSHLRQFLERIAFFHTQRWDDTAWEQWLMFLFLTITVVCNSQDGGVPWTEFRTQKALPIKQRLLLMDMLNLEQDELDQMQPLQIAERLKDEGRTQKFLDARAIDGNWTYSNDETVQLGSLFEDSTISTEGDCSYRLKIDTEQGTLALLGCVPHLCIARNLSLPDKETILDRKDVVRRMNKQFEWRKRIRLAASPVTDIKFHDEPVYYDSEEEDLVHVNRQPHSFLIIGRQFTGKRELAKRISKHYNKVNLDIVSEFEKHYAARHQSPYADKIEQSIEQRVLPTDLKMTLFRDRFYTSEVQHRGYVHAFDPLDSTSSEQSETEEPGSIEGITALLEMNLPKYIIHLSVDDDDQEYRSQQRNARTVQDIETAENQLQSILELEELEKQPKKRKETVPDDPADESEKGADEEEQEEGETEDENEKTEEEEEEEEDEESLERKQFERKEREKRKRQLILQLTILHSRQHLQNSNGRVSEENDTFSDILSRIHRRKYIRVHADQSDDDIFFQILQQLEKETPEPLAIVPKLGDEDDDENSLEDAAGEESLDDVAEKYPYKMSWWSRYCPVTYNLENGRLLECGNDDLFPSIYRGRLYCLSSKQYREKFARNPRRFIRKRPRFSGSLLVIGHPHKQIHQEYFDRLAGHYLASVTDLDSYLVTLPPLPERSPDEEDGEDEEGKNEDNNEPDNENDDDEDDELQEENEEQDEMELEVLSTIGDFNDDADEGSIFHSNVRIIDALHYVPSVLDEVVARHGFPDHTIVLEIPGEEEEEEEEEGDEEEEGEEGYQQSDPGTTDSKEIFLKRRKYQNYFDELMAKMEEIEPAPAISRVSIEENDTSDAICAVFKDFDTFYELPEDSSMDFDPDQGMSVEQRWKLGSTGHFCSVNLHDRGILVKGDTDLCVKYRNHYYFFDTETDMDKFKKSHLKYVRPVTALPAPSLWILGLECSGRDEYASFLSSHNSMSILKFDRQWLEELAFSNDLSEAKDWISQRLEEQKAEEEAKQRKLELQKKRQEEEESDYEEEDEEEEEIDDDELKAIELEKTVQLFKEVVKAEPYKSKGYIIDNGPSDETASDVLLNSGVYPDRVIYFKVPPSHFVNSEISDRIRNIKRKRSAKEREREAREMKREIKRKQRRPDDEDDEDEDDEDENEDEMLSANRSEVEEALNEEFETYTESVSTILEKIAERRVQYDEIDANAPRRKVEHMITGCTYSFTTARRSMLWKQQPCTMQKALNILRHGEKHLCIPFGFEDVVELVDKAGRSVLFYHPVQNCQTVTEELDTVDEEDIPPPPRKKKKVKKREEEEEEEESDEEEDDEEEDDEEEKDPEYQISRNLERPGHSFPVLLDNRVYFFTSEHNRQEFMRNPSRYIDQTNIRQFRQYLSKAVPNVAVLGGNEEKSFRSELAKRLADQLGVVYVDVHDILRKFSTMEVCKCSYLEEASKRILTDERLRVRREQEEKQAIADEREEDTWIRREKIILNTNDRALLYRLVKSRVAAFDCRTRGFVLDGMPMDMKQVSALRECGVEFDRVVVYGKDETDDDMCEVLSHYEQVQQNVLDLGAQTAVKTDWHRQVIIREQVKQCMANRAQLRLNRRIDHAAALYDTGISQDRFDTGLSTTFGEYCPVCYVRDGILMDCTKLDPDHRWCVELRDVIFRTCSENHLVEFMSSADWYSSVEHTVPTLPAISPISNDPNVQDEDENSEDGSLINGIYALRGFCPVMLSTRVDGEQVLVWGRRKFSVQYDNRVFRMSTQETMYKFMKQPWKYANVSLPAKIPHRIREYPMLDIVQYLDETVQRLISKALIEINKLRPYYPHMHAQEAAIKFVALYLRANHQSYHQERAARCRQDCEDFLDSCQLIPYFSQLSKAEEEEEREDNPPVYERDDYRTKATLYDDIRNKATLYDDIRNKIHLVPGSGMY